MKPPNCARIRPLAVRSRTLERASEHLKDQLLKCFFERPSGTLW